MRTARQPHAEWSSWKNQSVQSQENFQARHFISTRGEAIFKKKLNILGFFLNSSFLEGESDDRNYK